MLSKLFAVFFFLISNVVFATKITAIEINGLTTLSRGTVLNYLPFEVNDDVNEKDIKSAFDILTKTGLFKENNFQLIGSILKINAIENPTIKYFDFVDYKDGLVLSESQIEDIKINSDLSIGKIFNPEKLKKLVSQIISLYKNNAFYQTKITAKTSIDSSNRIGIELVFNEGDPSLISSFRISGNSFFTEEELLDEFEIGEPDFFIINYFTDKDRFDKVKFEAGIEKIKTKYINSGFLDLNIYESEVKVDSKNSTIQISINIKEGNRYKIKNISFTGDTDIFPREKLLDQMGNIDNSFFSKSKILKGIENIRSIFSNRGYAFAEIDSKLNKTASDFEYDLEVNLNKNNLVYINRIEISGNNRTQDDVIRREMIIHESNFFSQEDIDESIRKIRRLGYFSNVSVKTSKVNNDSDKLNIFIDVIETKTGEFSVGLSHSNSTGAAFTAGIQQSNILGTGNTFNGKFTNSSAVQEISFFFSDPYFNKEGHTISYGIFNKTTDAADLEVSNYNIDESGFTFGYGIPITDKSKLSANMRFSDINVTCGSTFSSSGYEPIQCSSNDKLDTSLNLRYSHNSLNDFYSPTNGLQSSISSTLSTPPGDFKYLKVEGNIKNYSPVYENFTFLTEADLQIAKGYADKDLPFFKRFYGGGSSSVRGFDFNTLGAKYPDGKAKGGELSYFSSAALISPAKNLGIDQENIRIGAFLDAGSVSESTSSFDLSDIRASTGLGLSWLTPIGPIGFYAAKPLIKKDGDSLETFSFDLGMSF